MGGAEDGNRRILSLNVKGQGFSSFITPPENNDGIWAAAVPIIEPFACFSSLSDEFSKGTNRFFEPEDMRGGKEIELHDGGQKGGSIYKGGELFVLVTKAFSRSFSLQPPPPPRLFLLPVVVLLFEKVLEQGTM